MNRFDLIEQIVLVHAMRWEHRESELRCQHVEAKRLGKIADAARIASDLLDHQRYRNDLSWGLGLEDELAKIQ